MEVSAFENADELKQSFTVKAKLWRQIDQEAKNRPNIPLEEKFHRGILRGLRNIPDTP